MSVNSFKVSQELYELISFIEYTANKTHKRRNAKFSITLNMDEFRHIKDKVEEIYQLSKPVFITYDDSQTVDKIEIVNENFYTVGELKDIKDSQHKYKMRDLK